MDALHQKHYMFTLNYYYLMIELVWKTAVAHLATYRNTPKAKLDFFSRVLSALPRVFGGGARAHSRMVAGNRAYPKAQPDFIPHLRGLHNKIQW